MAEIKSYFREKEKSAKNQGDYRDKIRKYRLTNLYRIGLLIGVVAAVLALIVVQYRNHVYTGYDLVSTVPLEKVEGAQNIRLKDSILTYSKDGAHCTNGKGVVTWNQTYEIQDILMSICQGAVAIGDYNGREIYVQNTEKQLGSISTNMPIRAIDVSAVGNVTAVLADTNVTWINTYDSSGQMLFTGQVHMQEAGYPLAISLSPNGMLLGVCYVYLDAGIMKTNVVFYNFGPVGENNSDHIVSVYTYSDMLVPEIHFVDNETAFAVGDNRLMIFKGSQTPMDSLGCVYSKEILSVFYGEKHIGLVLASDDAEHVYMLDVYSVDGKKVGTYYFDLDYNDIFFEENTFVIYNETECYVSTYSGVEKYKGTFTKPVNMMLATGSPFRYLLLTELSMDTIQLK